MHTELIFCQIPKEGLELLQAKGIRSFAALLVGAGEQPHLLNTLNVDKNKNRLDALTDIYRVMRPGEPPHEESAEQLFYGLFLSLVSFGFSHLLVT